MKYNYGGLDVITENNFFNSGILVDLADAPIVDKNYWSAYTAKYPNAKEGGSSGIWDTPYFNATIDYHPLVNLITDFEITEFSMDKLQNLQDFSTQGVYLKSLPSHLGKFEMVMDPLTDTDIDMIFNLLGALAYSPVLFLNRRIKGEKGTFREMLNERP